MSRFGGVGFVLLEHLQLLSWSEFHVLLLGDFFSHSVKQKLEGDLRHLQQGSRPLQEYIREFM